MVRKLTFAGLRDKLTEEVERHGGRLPERIAFVWYGYLAALLLYDLISLKEYSDLCDLLPRIEDNPVGTMFIGRQDESDTE